MLTQTKNIANIEIINTDNYLNEHGYYEIDFHPDKDFPKGEIYVFFHIVESWGSVHWYKLFLHYAKQGYKVVLYTSFNFLPIAKNLCHKAYLEKTPIFQGFYRKNTPRMSSYGLQRGRFWELYDIGKKGGYVEARPWVAKWWSSETEAGQIAQSQLSQPILIDQKEFDNFMKQKHEFGESQVVLESKGRVNNVLREKLQAKDGVHADHSWQREILTKYTKFSYATYQILLSMYCGYSFVGVRGAACLLTALPVNFIIGTDLYNMNFTSSAVRYHDVINRYYYNIPTGGFCHDHTKEGQIEDTWREAAILYAVDDYLGRDHYVPLKQITHFSSVNKKLKFLLDK